VALLKTQRDCSPVIAGALILALLLGGLPMLTGVVIVSDSTSQPAFTVDICHPLGAVTQTLNTAEAPLIPAQLLWQTLPDSGSADQSVITLRSRLGEAPIPPPPRSAL
jgi:hypothetical protein